MEQYFIEFTTVGKAEGNDGKGDDIVKFVFFVKYSNIQKASHDNDQKLGQISKNSRKTAVHASEFYLFQIQYTLLQQE